MSRHVLQGPFLTRSDAAVLAHVSPRLVCHRPDLLRVGGRWLPEVYFAFQFDEHGVRPGLAAVVAKLKRTYCDRAVSEWLASPHPHLDNVTPIAYVNRGGPVEDVMAAAERDGPDLTQPEPSGGIRLTADHVGRRDSGPSSPRRGSRPARLGRGSLGSKSTVGRNRVRGGAALSG